MRFVVLLTVLTLAPVLSAAPMTGEVIFTSAFQQGLDGWSGGGAGAEVVDLDGRKALRITAGAKQDRMVRRPLDVAAIRGLRLTMSASVRADKVDKPAEPWNGVKLMAYTKGPSGETYTGLNDVHGSFGFTTLGRTVVIPPDATEASLILGLQDAGGTVYFRDVTLTVTGVPRKRPATRPALTARRANLRGVMYGPAGKEQDLRKLAEWKGNLIRWQFYSWAMNQPEHQRDLAKYDRFIDEQIAEVDRWLPLCEQLGIKVVIDLHTPPGGLEQSQMAVFGEGRFQQKFIEVWDKLARHYKDKPAVWAYDLLNEPVEGRVGEGLRDWRGLAEHVARRVRAIDGRRAIIVEPGPFGGWDNLPYFQPLDVPGIVYSVHLYEPMKFTHQGVLDGMPVGARYPGDIDGQRWDRAALRKLLQPVVDYQLDYNVPIYVGEFSAIRWAPGDDAARYIGDCISLFEELGWDWSYHAFREWHGWDVEVDGDRATTQRTTTPTQRGDALRRGLRQNPPRQ